MRITGRLAAALALTALALGPLWACHGKRGAMAPSELEALEQFRAQRLERLTAPDGWLSLIGLHWLTPGRQTFGSGRGCDIVLPDPAVPEVAGSLELTDEGRVLLRAGVPEAVTVNGIHVATATLTDDGTGNPDIVRTGRIQFYVIRRGDRLGVRIKDPESPARKTFKGLAWYPPDARYRVVARLEPFPRPRIVRVATKIGTPAEFTAPGTLRFTLEGRTLSLLPLVEGPDSRELFIVFRDATSGKTTYGAGRFLDAHLEDDGTAILDFNRAVNPPCAFTPYATCPLAPPENDLPVPIPAGEKLPPGHHGH